jgi:hypothetical protein
MDIDQISIDKEVKSTAIQIKDERKCLAEMAKTLPFSYQSGEWSSSGSQMVRPPPRLLCLLQTMVRNTMLETFTIYSSASR